MPVSSGCPPSMPCPRGFISAGCSNAPLGWRPPSASAASQTPECHGAEPGLTSSRRMQGLIGGMLFHLSGLASPAALGGAVCAPRTGESVNPASRATTETTKRLDISEMPPAGLDPNPSNLPADQAVEKPQHQHWDGLGPLVVAALTARPSDSYGWNCLPLITMRFLGAVGLALPRNATGLPFLAGMASISTSSPGLNVFLVQPICASWTLDFDLRQSNAPRCRCRPCRRVSRKRGGGLNGSTQHFLEAHLQRSQYRRSFAIVNSKAEPPCLGMKEHCPIDRCPRGSITGSIN